MNGWIYRIKIGINSTFIRSHDVEKKQEQKEKG
jgi:hypothetical protein